MKKLIEMRNSKKGFTLVEIIVVLAILAVLIAVAMPNLMGILKQSKAKVMMQDARAVYVAVQDALIEGTIKSGTTAVDAKAEIDKLVSLPDTGAVAHYTLDAKNQVSDFSYTNATTLTNVGVEGTWYVQIKDGKTKLVETTDPVSGGISVTLN